MDVPRLLARVRECMEFRPASSTKIQPDPVVLSVVKKLVEFVRTQDALAALDRAVRVVRPAPRAAPESVLLACAPTVRGGGKLLGAGYFGRVYQFGKDRAIKVVSLMNARTRLDESLRAWNREVQWSRKAGKMGIGPKVYDSFVCVHESQPHGFMVMDLVRGTSFSQWRDTAAPDALEAAERLLEAKIKKMHAAGLVHGDLHGGNVLVIGTRKAVKNVVVLDFGFARSVPQVFEDELLDVKVMRTGRQPATDQVVLAVARALIEEKIIVPAPPL